MPTVQPFPAGGYRFIAHQFQYSGGVAAEPGFRIERARFARSLPLADGFDAIEAYLARIGRSPTAFCACELRSPEQFTDAGFVANRNPNCSMSHVSGCDHAPNSSHTAASCWGPRNRSGSSALNVVPWRHSARSAVVSRTRRPAGTMAARRQECRFLLRPGHRAHRPRWP